MVPQLRLPAARRHRLPAGAEGARGRADGRPGPGSCQQRDRRQTRLPPPRPDRPQLVDPADVQAAARHGRPRRPGLPQGHGYPAPRGLQHARQPVLLEPRRAARSTRRPPPVSISSSSTRRATTSTATGWRWTACCPTARSSPLAAGSRAQGLNAVLHTTHRQNFLVPPRRHRSFPLVERLELAEERLRHVYQSSGTVFSSAVASSSETSTISSPLQRGHAPEPALVDEVRGLEPVARREHAVARSGRAAALDVAEHRHPRLVAGALLDLLRQLARRRRPGSDCRTSVPALAGSSLSSASPSARSPR